MLISIMEIIVLIFILQRQLILEWMDKKYSAAKIFFQLQETWAFLQL